MVPRTLRGLGAAFLAMFVATVLLVGIAIYAATHQTLDAEVDRRLASEAALLVPDPQHVDLPTILRQIDRLERRRESRDLGFMLVDRAGRHVGGTLAMPLPPPGFSAIDRSDGIPGLVRGRALMLPVGADHRLAMIAESEPIDNFDSVFVRVLLVGLGTIALMVVLGVVLLTRTIGHRIGDLRTAAEAIMRGDLDRRVRVDASGSEFDEQARLLNHMLDRIQQLMAGIRHVAHDAAHDLRTPLARLRGSLSALVRQAEGGPLHHEIEGALHQTEDTLKLFSAFLRIAEIEGDDRRARFERVDLSQLTQDIAAAYAPTIADNGRGFDIDVAAGIAIDGDPQLLNQMLANLLDNCLTHTPAGTAIALSLSSNDAQAIIAVTDRGGGIAASDRAVAMQRFGRLNANDLRGGHGLGLPLVASIVRHHAGDLTLADATPGLRVVLRFSRAARG